jgi:3-oxoadipate enol-lactonase
VVRYDLRGHGASPVPPGPYALADLGADLVQLLDRLDIARAHLVGLSLGAMVSLWVAARHPARVRRLAVCCTAARLGPPEAWAERARVVRAGGAGAIAEAVVDRWFTPGFRQRDPERLATMRTLVAATSREGYAGCCAAIETMDLRGDLPAITAPTLAIAGADDPATPPERLREIAEAIPGARLAVVPGAAHLANVEQPERITELLLGHLQEDQR